MTRIRISHVEKGFGPVIALSDCNLEIGEREFVVLVGPSGSGKTTLLRCIAGLEHITRGDLYFDDLRVNDVDVGERDIAMVFQNYGLYPHMSVFDNMAFGLRRRGVAKAEVSARVRKAAELLNIVPYLARRPRQLSGGQRQRVALGRAIVRDPAVFLLDEPLSNLDAHLRVQMRAEILRVHKAVGATAVYVTHDQIEALTMGDRIAVMADGRIQQVGTPDELYEMPVNKFVASFIGTPAMGFMSCRVSRNDGTVALETSSGRFQLLPEQSAAVANLTVGAITVGIRPERLSMGASNGTSAGRNVEFGGIVEAVENHGAEQLVHFRTDGGYLTARLPRGSGVKTGDTGRLSANVRYLHLFDPDTGRSLGYRSAG
jgi:multiple sugar transport system ATP-binding protein